MPHATAHDFRRLRFAVVAVASLAPDWLASRDGQLGMSVSLQTASVYALKHNYSLVLVTQPAPGNETAYQRLDWAKVYSLQRLMSDDSGRRLDCSRYDWLFWLESDVLITNLTVPLHSLVEDALRKRGDGYPASAILTIDAASNVNTGTGLVRCSEGGLALLRALAELRHTAADTPQVRAWVANGAAVLLMQEARWRRHVVILPARRLNAYPRRPDLHGPLCGIVLNASKADCPEDDVHWEPGDFVAHFAGVYPKWPAVERLLEAFPQASWPGYVQDIAPSVA